jgi:NTP pyrophosphatase (non-canonical NTP hydrolase)
MLTIDEMAEEAYANSVAHGFWTGEANNNLPTKLALIHAEVSEALEALRHGNPPSEHVPSISALEEELADVVIRVGDLAFEMGFDLGGAVQLKMQFNATRPVMHGGKAF